MVILRGVFPDSKSVVVVVIVGVTIDRVLEGFCVLLLFVSILFEVIIVSTSDILGRVVGLDIISVEEYALVLLSFIGAPEVLGSCVSTGSLTQDGSVEPSTVGGLYVTKTKKLLDENIIQTSSF